MNASLANLIAMGRFLEQETDRATAKWAAWKIERLKTEVLKLKQKLADTGNNAEGD